jgi:N-acetylglucosamine malate deacetylase 1
MGDMPGQRRLLSRRHLLRGLSATAALPLLDAARPLCAAEPSDAAAPPERRKLRVVVTGGHPGDPEYGCGGTIARYTDLGHEAVLLYLNRGDPAETASRPASDVRVKEAEKACGILKARPVFAGQIDAHAVVDEEHYGQFRRLLEAEKPDAVFTHWPIDNHADHRAMSMLVYDAWLRLGRKFALYYYEVSNGEDTLQFAPTHYVDISQAEPRKRQACQAHASQAPGRYYALQETVTRMRGFESGHEQAEAYVRHIQSPDFALPPAG